jgi:hypothetical protein
VNEKKRPNDKTGSGFGGMDLSCPKNDEGHEWAPPHLDELRRCLHCGRQGRHDARDPEGTSFLAAASTARAEFFQTLRAPASAHGKVKKS